jgi:hypothetical protein
MKKTRSKKSRDTVPLMVQFWTELPDARMSMPAALDLMPTPSFVENKDYLDVFLLDKIFRFKCLPRLAAIFYI